MFFFLLGVLFITPLVLWYTNERKRKSLPLPPGPRGWPIVGNLFSLPEGYVWEVYNQWCTQYGTDILYLNLAGTPLMIVNTYELAIELLEIRSAQYSGRAPMTMVNELMGWDFNFAWMDYGEVWLAHCDRSINAQLGSNWAVRRQQRKLFHHDFQQSAVHQFNPQQLRSARALALKLKNTQNILADIRQMAGEIIIAITYGLDVLPQNDPYIEAAEQSVQTLLEALIPGAFFVDSIPIMKYIPDWIPGATFKKQARRWREGVERMRNLPFDALLKSIENGTSKPSFGLRAMQLVQSGIGGAYTEDNVKSVAGVMYQTGSDTILSTVSFCILSLLDHPHVFKIAQDELDSITNCSRLPDFNDETLTPYLGAIIKETLRYWSIVPLGVFHLTHLEDEYKGFMIPAESVIVPNAWAMLHNANVFPDPFTFKPERFLGIDPKRDSHFESIFGFGRRICPGRYMAFQTAWIAIATILSIYDIKKALGPDGKPIEPSSETSSSILILPKPFQCSFTVRSVASVLYSELAANSEEL